VGFNPTRYGNEGYHSAYKKLAIKNPNYNNWVQLFEHPNARIKYWSDILIKMETPSTSINEENKIPQISRSNYSDTIVNNGQIAIMKILSFDVHSIEKDKDAITLFLNKIRDCKYLIIDIQENSGGAVKYWTENIVERLINDTVVYKSYPVIKGGQINRHFYPEFFANAKVLKKTDSLPLIPKELINEKYYIGNSMDTIIPHSPIGFKGKIFLLVSRKVFSSSEGFAQFCKTTGWATVVGERTGGDGIGGDPAFILLPESGILMCFPSLVGLNNDGSINAEERTLPDVIFNGSTSQERLGKLINYLTQDF